MISGFGKWARPRRQDATGYSIRLVRCLGEAASGQGKGPQDSGQKEVSKDTREAGGLRAAFFMLTLYAVLAERSLVALRDVAIGVPD